jgi:hypothetical protein
MLSINSPQFKGLTAPQKAKARKALEQWKAERDPIMYASNTFEQEIRRQAFEDMDAVKLCQQIEDEFNPRLEELAKKINELSDERRRLEDEKRARFDAINAEPYRIASNHPKSILLHEMWKETNARHEAKIADLLESFKTEGVA